MEIQVPRKVRRGPVKSGGAAGGWPMLSIAGTTTLRVPRSSRLLRGAGTTLQAARIFNFEPPDSTRNLSSAHIYFAWV